MWYCTGSSIFVQRIVLQTVVFANSCLWQPNVFTNKMSSSPQLITINSDDYFTTDPGIPFHLLRRQKRKYNILLASRDRNLLHVLLYFVTIFHSFNEKLFSSLSIYVLQLFVCSKTVLRRNALIKSYQWLLVYTFEIK